MSPELSKLVALSMQDIHDLLSALDRARPAYDQIDARWKSLEVRLLEQMRSDIPKFWAEHP